MLNIKDGRVINLDYFFKYSRTRRNGERDAKISRIFRVFSPLTRTMRHAGPVMRPSTTRTQAALPHMARRLSSRVTDNNTTDNGVRARASSLRAAKTRCDAPRISEGAIFETSSRRAGDLRSLVVASIITATIVREFIGISIKAARAERIFCGQWEFSRQF